MFLWFSLPLGVLGEGEDQTLPPHLIPLPAAVGKGQVIVGRSDAAEVY